MKKSPFFNIYNSLGSMSSFSGNREAGSYAWFMGRGTKMNQAVTKYKFRVLILLAILFFIILFGRVFWLQVVRGGEYGDISEGNRIRTRILPAHRGLIYDRFGNPLVTNTPRFRVYLVPADLPNNEVDRKNVFSSLISTINGLSQSNIDAVLLEADPRSFSKILLIDNLSHEESISLSIIERELPGVEFSVIPRRQYLEGVALSHVLGYVGLINNRELEKFADSNYLINDYIGKNGLELTYEKYLRGVSGREEVEVDARGKPKKILGTRESVVGQSLVTSLNVDLQKELSKSLAKAIAGAPESSGGVGIAIDPNNGEILALVSLPGFDNNFFSAGIGSDAYNNYLEDPNQPLFNRAISGTYPPGSVFKPIVALAALEEGIINSRKTFLSTGGISINEWYFPDWKYGGHGRVNVTRAIAESVNTFFYYIGGGYSNFEGLGVKRIREFARKFYLSDYLGIDIPGEVKGFLPSKEWKERVKGERWYIGDTYHLAIGQGDILTTPLQVASYTAAIAGGGTLYRPHFFKGMVSGENYNEIEMIDDISSDYILNNQLASPENIETIRHALRETVVSGSARSLNYLPVLVAGKTGTAQVGGDKETHAWFTGFAPYDNPQIVLTVLVENGGEGSSVAVPVFKEVINWYFSEE